jgi:hypothetical protein
VVAGGAIGQRVAGFLTLFARWHEGFAAIARDFTFLRQDAADIEQIITVQVARQRYAAIAGPAIGRALAPIEKGARIMAVTAIDADAVRLLSFIRN